MKKLTYVALTAFALLVLSCSDKKAFVTTFKGNIEGGDWINNGTIGYYGGNTGDCCSRADSVNEYSYGMRKLLTEINANPIKRIKVSVYFKLAQLEKKCFLVVAVNGPNDEKIYWAGHELNAAAKEANKWYKLDAEDLLPEYKMEGAIASIYVWSPNKNIVFVDDYAIQFLEE